MHASFAGLRRLGQIYMRASDLARATAFYRDTLEVPFLFEVPRMAFFDLSGVRLMLGEPEGPAFDHPGSILYFDVPDLELAHLELARRGVAFDSAPHLVADMGDRELWMAFFKDSEGSQLALMSEIPK
ncbi:MAG: VOC family protein [Longimicrobiales bacterium]